jgi:hypothetical protein
MLVMDNRNQTPGLSSMISPGTFCCISFHGISGESATLGTSRQRGKADFQRTVIVLFCFAKSGRTKHRKSLRIRVKES